MIARAMSSTRSLATLLFADIVDSTRQAAEMGDAAWHEVLESFFGIVRRELRRHVGQEINTTGDGLVAAFARPALGIHCAWTIRDAVRGLGIEVRSGLHMGEVEKGGRGIGGVAVHIASRVADKAHAREILVTQTIRDAEEGSGFKFKEQGAYPLKGVSGEWRLYAVESVPAMAPVSRWDASFRSPERHGALVGLATFLLLLLLLAVYIRRGDHSPAAGDHVPSRPLVATHRQVTFLGSIVRGALSPDGKTIAYVTGNDDSDSTGVFVRDLAGGEPLEIARLGKSVRDIRWSPTGENLLLATHQHADDRQEILLLPRLGGAPRVFPGAAFQAWSPDERRLVTGFHGEKQLEFLEISTGARVSIALPDSFTFLDDVDWSPRADRLAYLTADSSRFAIWTISLPGGVAHRAVDDSVELRNPRWSRTGDSIYYLRHRGEMPDLVKVGISSSTGVATSTPEILLSGDMVAVSEFDVSDDGSRILYQRYQEHSNLWLVEPLVSAGPEVSQLTRGTEIKTSPSISPDGQMIAFSMRTGESQNIHLLPLAGGATKQLTFLEGPTCCPAWSPDGKEIAFFSLHGGKPQVWKMELDGGAPVPFSGTEATTESHWPVHWAPGASILYQRPGNRNFHLLDPDTGEERPLVSNEELGWMFNPRYSPDGSKVAVFWNRRDRRGLWVISLKGGEQALVAEGAQYPLGWSPDGTLIYTNNPYTAPYQIIRYSIADGSAVVVATLECVPRSMTSDAKRFVCVWYEGQSDLWIAENFDPTGLSNERE